jgi:hypothetical protein
MKFVFLSAYEVFGIAQGTSDPDVVLFDSSNPKTKVIVTRQLSKYWPILDRHVALNMMLMMGFVGKPLSDDFNVRLEEQIRLVGDRRSKSIGSNGILIIEIQGDIDAEVKEPKHINDDYVLCFDAYDKKSLHSQLQIQIAPILVAVRIGGSRNYELESIGSGSYLIDSEGKIIYSSSFESGNANAYVSSKLTIEQIARAQEDIKLLLGDKNINSVFKLFAHSLE